MDKDQLSRLNMLLTRALDALIAAAQPHEGLFPSLIDRRTGTMLTTLPAAIPGQRDGDRAFPGSNLIHDEATLKTLYALASAWNRPDYAVAADRYLQHFASHCTNTATGLFPWGEHSFWHLTENRVGNSYVHDKRFESMGQHLPPTHDHLRQAPLWLWEKLWAFNPRCVERFAEGLDFHWQQGERKEYIRHANIEERTHPTPNQRSCDFPRHGGFYIFDWAYFDDAPLPRGALGVDWYESQMGPGFLLHGLARTALLAEDRNRCPLAADYTAR